MLLPLFLDCRSSIYNHTRQQSQPSNHAVLIQYCQLREHNLYRSYKTVKNRIKYMQGFHLQRSYAVIIRAARSFTEKN